MYFSPIQSNFSLFALTVNSSPHKTTIFKLAAVLDMPKNPFLRLIFEIDPSNTKFGASKWWHGIKRI